MNRHNERPYVFAARAGPALLLLGLCWQSISAAPAPFERSPVRSRHLHPDDLVGTWTMTWASYRCTVTLSAAGDYTCLWGGATYVGSWRLDHNRHFWITESTTPADPHSWRSYAVRLDPMTLSGRVEVGSPGTEVRLERVRLSPVK